MDVGYAVRLRPAFLGGFFVSCRDLPELLSHGEDPAAALLRTSDTMDVLLTDNLDEDRAPPLPTPVQPGELLVKPPAQLQSLLRPYFR